MTLLSIVMPVYRAAGPAQRSLDALLSQSFSNIQVLAVDDGSRDGTGHLLDSYAARDPRVDVLHLPERVGAGQARNAGLAHARGEYVWFIDSGDILADGSLADIADRLTGTRPDVLVVEHARLVGGRRVLHHISGRILRDAPPTFRATEYPDILRVAPRARNKIVRQQFLSGWNLRFPTGYYEDIPVAYPLLVGADRIATLDRVCLLHRQRTSRARGGWGPQHLELLGQYELTFQRLMALGDRAEPLLPIVFDRAVAHLLTMLGSGDKVGAGFRRPYFQQAGKLCALYQPAGYAGPRRVVDRLAYRLLSQGSWPMYQSLWQAQQLLRTVGPALHRGAHGLRAGLSRAGHLSAGRRQRIASGPLPSVPSLHPLSWPAIGVATDLEERWSR